MATCEYDRRVIRVSPPIVPRVERANRSAATYSKAYISFGGLLMSLDGPYKKLTPLRVDYVYLLVKK